MRPSKSVKPVNFLKAIRLTSSARSVKIAKRSSSRKTARLAQMRALSSRISFVRYRDLSRGAPEALQDYLRGDWSRGIHSADRGWTAEFADYSGTAATAVIWHEPPQSISRRGLPPPQRVKSGSAVLEIRAGRRRASAAAESLHRQ